MANYAASKQHELLIIRKAFIRAPQKTLRNVDSGWDAILM